MKTSTQGLIGSLTYLAAKQSFVGGFERACADAAERLAELDEDNRKLKGELLTLDAPRGVKRFRLTENAMEGTERLVEHEQGEYVTWEEFEWMANYADQLVAFNDLPCLPADLKYLREANLELAMEVYHLRESLTKVTKLLNDTEFAFATLKSEAGIKA